MAAPPNPPSNACEELDGKPTNHVNKFQTIAPTSPAKITSVVTKSACTHLATAFATCTPKNHAAAKFHHAAQHTAWNGRSTRVPTTVAMELAASWKPLMKSN